MCFMRLTMRAPCIIPALATHKTDAYAAHVPMRPTLLRPGQRACRGRAARGACRPRLGARRTPTRAPARAAAPGRLPGWPARGCSPAPPTPPAQHTRRPREGRAAAWLKCGLHRKSGAVQARLATSLDHLTRGQVLKHLCAVPRRQFLETFTLERIFARYISAVPKAKWKTRSSTATHVRRN